MQHAIKLTRVVFVQKPFERTRFFKIHLMKVNTTKRVLKCFRFECRLPADGRKPVGRRKDGQQPTSDATRSAGDKQPPPASPRERVRTTRSHR